MSTAELFIEQDVEDPRLHMAQQEAWSGESVVQPESPLNIHSFDADELAVILSGEDTPSHLKSHYLTIALGTPGGDFAKFCRLRHGFTPSSLFSGYADEQGYIPQEKLYILGKDYTTRQREAEAILKQDGFIPMLDEETIEEIYVSDIVDRGEILMAQNGAYQSIIRELDAFRADPELMAYAGGMICRGEIADLTVLALHEQHTALSKMRRALDLKAEAVAFFRQRLQDEPLLRKYIQRSRIEPQFDDASAEQAAVIIGDIEVSRRYRAWRMRKVGKQALKDAHTAFVDELNDTFFLSGLSQDVNMQDSPPAKPSDPAQAPRKKSREINRDAEKLTAAMLMYARCEIIIALASEYGDQMSDRIWQKKIKQDHKKLYADVIFRTSLEQFLNDRETYVANFDVLCADPTVTEYLVAQGSQIRDDYLRRHGFGYLLETEDE